MANLKLNNPQVVGKLKLPAETANKVLTVDGSGQLTSATASTTELGYLVGVTSAIQTQISAKADASSLSGYVPTTTTVNGHALSANVTVSASDVGLGNVDNTSDATKNAAAVTLTNKSIDATTNTITNIADSSISSTANIAQSKISGLTTTLAAKADLVAGKVPVAQLPSALMTFKGAWNASTNSPTLADGTGTAGDVYRASVAGTASWMTDTGPKNFAVGDLIIYTGTVWQHAPAADAVTSVNGYVGAVTLVKADVGLGNVDNTSDATKNSAVATLTNKTIDIASNTVSNIATSNFASGVIDTDVTLTANSDTKLATQKATKAYVDSKIGASGVTGDIALTTFAASNNISSAANVTGLAFAAASVRSFRVQLSVAISATSNLNEVFELMGVQTASGFVMSTSSVGDDSGVIFSITSAGQVQYTSTNISGFTANKIQFRAWVTNT